MTTLAERRVKVIRSVVEAYTALHHGKGCVFLIRFPEQTSAEQLSRLEQMIGEYHQVVWIALVPPGWQQHEHLCGLITRAFYDYHHLPPEWERLRITIGHAFGMLKLRRQFEELAGYEGELDQLIGQSSPIKLLREQVRKVAQSPATVLLAGESGSGKELVARALHQLSNRKEGPFEAVNCAALPASLIQAELFGSERGAFTDAHQRKLGRFELADGGTLFLDEIGDMPLEQQVNLLRVLEQGALRRIGGNRDIPIDVRIVCATHCDLAEAVREGRFREDLYYRLNVVKLDIPPLRARDDDIELLARNFFQRLRPSVQGGPRGFSREALELMSGYHWPGNVRELLNRIQHAIVMAEGPLIQPHDLGLERRDSPRQQITLEEARRMAEYRAINDALHRHRHNVSEAARELGVSRATLYRLLERHAISPQ